MYDMSLIKQHYFVLLRDWTHKDKDQAFKDKH